MTQCVRILRKHLKTVKILNSENRDPWTDSKASIRVQSLTPKFIGIDI